MDAAEILKAYSALLDRAEAAIEGQRYAEDFDRETAELYQSSAGAFVVSWTSRDDYDGGSWRSSASVPMAVLDMSDSEFEIWNSERKARIEREVRAASVRYAAETAARERAQYEALRQKFG